MLLENYTSLLQEGWHGVFAQERTHRRAIEHALSLPIVLGRRTISRTICTLDRAHQDWSADYKLFSRNNWKTEGLFTPVVREYLNKYPKGPVSIAFDDTKVAKSGKKIAGASWQRDPMSPPFHVNFLYGLRFIQGSLLFPCYRSGGELARAMPVCFENAPFAKKPGKRATQEEKWAYYQAKKEKNLSTQTLSLIEGLRRQLDEQGAWRRDLLAVVDGSFCNRTMFRAGLGRVHFLARCRKDARLCLPALKGGRRKYAVEIFTPEQVRRNKLIAWKRTRIYYAGERRWIRYKIFQNVLWRRGAGTRPLQLIVIAPHPYRLSKHSRTNYRDPAYLLTTDLKSSRRFLIQNYFDRWQIEVNHRDEKSLLGVGQAQVRSPRSIPRHPAFTVASYSMLWLAALQTFGTNRTDQFCPLPKWRKNASRYSTLDLLTLLRKEIHNETSVSGYVNANMAQNLIHYAYT